MKVITSQAVALKNILEVLKDTIKDVNIHFKLDGVSITTKTLSINTHMLTENFDEYICPHEKDICVNLTSVYEILKSVQSDDILIISIVSKKFMFIEIHGEQRKTRTNFTIELMDIAESYTDTTDRGAVYYQPVHRNMSTTSTLDGERIAEIASLDDIGRSLQPRVTYELKEKISRCVENNYVYTVLDSERFEEISGGLLQPFMTPELQEKISRCVENNYVYIDIKE
jgi:hypothetical protein